MGLDSIAAAPDAAQYRINGTDLEILGSDGTTWAVVGALSASPMLFGGRGARWIKVVTAPGAAVLCFRPASPSDGDRAFAGLLEGDLEAVQVTAVLAGSTSGLVFRAYR